MLRIRVPATSANLGPGFDCLGLALDLWNEISFEAADRTTYQVEGEGTDSLNRRSSNILTKSMERLYEVCGCEMPPVRISAQNSIPLSSGLGSSAAAIIAGLFGANELLGRPMTRSDLLNLGTEIEGHPDNIAPALLGGLVVSVMGDDHVLTRRYELPVWTVVVAKPNVVWPTQMARSVLPLQISRADAVFNIGRTALVVDALCHGDPELLQRVMEDRLHQSYRLAHIPGGEAAFQAARAFGAAALSGAGPSLMIFVEPDHAEGAAAGVTAAFASVGVDARALFLHTTNLDLQLL